MAFARAPQGHRTEITVIANGGLQARTRGTRRAVARSVEAARQKILDELPSGYEVIDERITTTPSEGQVFGHGHDAEDAERAAMSALPSSVVVTERRLVRDVSTETIPHLRAFREESGIARTRCERFECLPERCAPDGRFARSDNAARDQGRAMPLSVRRRVGAQRPGRRAGLPKRTVVGGSYRGCWEPRHEVRRNVATGRKEQDECHPAFLWMTPYGTKKSTFRDLSFTALARTSAIDA
jgi:hypothetical protein